MQYDLAQRPLPMLTTLQSTCDTVPCPLHPFYRSNTEEESPLLSMSPLACRTIVLKQQPGGWRKPGPS